MSLMAFAVEKGNCSPDVITKFKEEYVKVQNALKYEGKNIELKNGKSVATGEDADSDHSPGHAVEEALYGQYKNALIKVGKIYQKLKNEPSESELQMQKENTDLVKFFKEIEPNNVNRNGALTINNEKLFEALKQVQISGFILTDEDVYLLKKLLIHSQDRICTLEQYKNNKAHSRTPYLEQINKTTLNKIIDSLRSLDSKQELKLADEEVTISEAIKDSFANLRKIILENKNCEKKLMNNPHLGDVIQTCNYNKFLKSLGADQFNQIESILHFLNVNQKAHNARTDLDWINTQFSLEAKPSCYIDPKTKIPYVQNFPMTEGQKIDTAKISCTEGTKKIKSEVCIKNLNFNLEDGLGMMITPKSTKGAHLAITSFTIKNSKNCNNVSIPQTDNQSEENDNECINATKEKWIKLKCAEKMTLESCAKMPEKEWRDKKCIDKITPEACAKLPNKEWRDNKCVDITQEACAKLPNKEWRDNKCVDITQEACAKLPNKEWRDNKCIDKITLEACAKLPNKEWRDNKCIDKITQEACAKLPNKEWRDNKCVDKITQEACVKLPNKEWRDNKCVDITPEACAKLPNKEWRDNKCVDITHEACAKLPNKEWRDNKCVDKIAKKEDLSEKEQCKKDDEDWINGAESDEDGAPVIRTSRYNWDSKEMKCKDKQEKNLGASADKFPEDLEAVTYPDKAIPSRYQPISIPTRQPWMLQGSP